MNKSVVILLGLLVFSTFTHISYAVSGSGSIRVAPALVEIDSAVDEGVGQSPIHYSNLSNQSLRIELSFLPITFNDSSPQMQILPKGSLLSQYIKPSASDFIIEAGETKTILLSYDFRSLLTSGDYYEALFARIISTSDKANERASISEGLSTTILVKNSTKGSNPQYSISPNGIQISKIIVDQPGLVSLQVRNQGQSYGIPRGQIVLKDNFGRILGTGTINTDSTRLFPGKSKIIKVALASDQPPLITYIGKIEVRIHDQMDKTAKEEVVNYSYIYMNKILLFSLIGLGMVGISYFLYVSTIKQSTNRSKSITR